MPSIFEGFKTPSLFPAVETARRGAEQARYGKEPFKVTAYKVKVFDMSKDADRDEYCELMERLMPLCQDAKCVVTKNELQVFNGAGWWRYVEWFEYELNETSLTTREPEDTAKKADEEREPELEDSDLSTDGFL